MIEGHMKGGQDLEDEKIVGLYHSRDELAIAATQDKYGKLCLGIAKKILGSEIDAEECFNDALLGLWKSIPPARPDNLKAYVCKTVRNLSFKRLSYKLAEKRSVNAEVPLEELEAVLPDGAARDALDRIDFSLLLDEFLQGLKPEARVIFTQRYFFFDSVSDISADLGISQSKVKSSLLRTRNKFKSYLIEKGSAL